MHPHIDFTSLPKTPATIKPLPGVSRRVILPPPEQYDADTFDEIVKECASDKVMKDNHPSVINPHTGEVLWIVAFETYRIITLPGSTLIITRDEAIFLEWAEDDANTLISWEPC